MINNLISSAEARQLLGVSPVTFWCIVRKYQDLRIAKIATRGKQELHYFERTDVLELRAKRDPKLRAN